MTIGYSRFTAVIVGYNKYIKWASVINTIVGDHLKPLQKNSKKTGCDTRFFKNRV